MKLPNGEGRVLMDFAFSPEQELLKETARRFVDKVCPPERAKEWDEAHHYPHELFDGFAELGWFDLPFAGGGAGDGAGDGEAGEAGAGGGRANVLECVLLAEELGRASLDVAQCYIVTLIAGLCIDKWGTPQMRAELFPELMAGRKRLAVGLSEPDAGSDAASLRTTAVDDGNRWIVNGQKMWCTGAGLPGTSILCYVRTDKEAPKHRGLSVMLIDPESPGVELRKIGTLARHILGTYEV